MPSRSFSLPKTALIAVVALIIGLEAPAAASQIAHQINGSSIKDNTVTGKQVKESTLASVPQAKLAKHAIVAQTLPPLVWHDLTLESPWVKSGGGGRAAYAIDAQGLVHLRGIISGGVTGSVAFTLPAEATPSKYVYEAVEASNGVGFLDVSANGQCRPYDQPGDPTTDVHHGLYLDGVTFSRY